MTWKIQTRYQGVGCSKDVLTEETDKLRIARFCVLYAQVSCYVG